MGYSVYTEVPKEYLGELKPLMEALPTVNTLFPRCKDWYGRSPVFGKDLAYKRDLDANKDLQCGFNYPILQTPELEYVNGVVACIAINLGRPMEHEGKLRPVVWIDSDPYTIFVGNSRDEARKSGLEHWAATNAVGLLLPRDKKDTLMQKLLASAFIATAKERKIMQDVLEEFSRSLQKIKRHDLQLDPVVIPERPDID